MKNILDKVLSTCLNYKLTLKTRKNFLCPMMTSFMNSPLQKDLPSDLPNVLSRACRWVAGQCWRGKTGLRKTGQFSVEYPDVSLAPILVSWLASQLVGWSQTLSLKVSY